MVKQYLTQRGISFVEKDVSADQAAAVEMVSRTGQQGVPVTEINGQFVVGFDQSRLEHLLKNTTGPTLGVSVANASQHAPKVGHGAYVGKVRPGSPAQQAGLQKGDVITQVGSRSIPDAATLVDISKRIALGQQVRVRFVRGDRTQETTLTL